MGVDESQRNFEHPLYGYLSNVPGMSMGLTTVDNLLTWGARHSLWIFPMATSCCAIEFMTAAASRVDVDQLGSVIRPTPRSCDVMVVAGTITVKMAPRVKKLWDQMPEPKWCIAMGSCAISGDFYRDIYSVIPGVDTVVPVDLYIPGCPPNADQVMAGLAKLQELVLLRQQGKAPPPAQRPETPKMIAPEIGRFTQSGRDEVSRQQLEASRSVGLGGSEHIENSGRLERQGERPEGSE